MSTPLQMLIFVAVLICAAKIAGNIAAHFHLPPVLGELLAGVLLGPTCFNFGILPWFAAGPGSHAVPVSAVFKVLAEMGVVILMFVAGLETDIALMRQAVAPAFWSAFGGVVLPMFGGAILSHELGFGWPESIFIGTILTATSVTITAQTLLNLNQLRSRAGSTILGAAVIDDVLGLIVLSVVIALSSTAAHSQGSDWKSIGLTLLRMVVCLTVLFAIGPRLTRWVLQQAGKVRGPHAEVSAAIVLAFLLAFFAEGLGGMAAITGSYLAGLFVAMTSARERVSHDLQAMTNSFFGPIFFVSIGLEVNAWQLGGRLGLFVLLLTAAIAGKIVGCGLGARLTGFSQRDSLIVGVGMIPRGEVGLITASLGWAAGLVSQLVYVQVVVLVLVTTIITPALLKFAFQRERMATPELPLPDIADAEELTRAAKAADA